MKILVENDYSHKAALFVKQRVLKDPKLVLGLATGKTPLRMYEELSEMNLDFSGITVFNLDEYLGAKKMHDYLWSNFLSKINIQKENVFLLNGLTENIKKHCSWYEKKIKEKGGIDLQILGIGRNGHIGLNEPGSSVNSRTRKVRLSEMTIKDNQCPNEALSVGIETIMASKEILLLASGENKSKAIKQMLEGEKVPASVLKKHPAFNLILDERAASSLPKKAIRL